MTKLHWQIKKDTFTICETVKQTTAQFSADVLWTKQVVQKIQTTRVSCSSIICMDRKLELGVWYKLQIYYLYATDLKKKRAY